MKWAYFEPFSCKSARIHFPSHTNLISKRDAFPEIIRSLNLVSVQSRLEKRMAIHIAASEAEWKKPGSYDEFTQRALEEAGLSQRKPTANALTVPPLSPEPSHAPKTTPAPTPRTNPGLAGNQKNAVAARPPISTTTCDAKSADKAKKSLQQRLMHVWRAWEEFQETRDRDAVYEYLRAVFSIVQHYRWKGRTKKLIRRAFEFAELPFDKNADPFAAVIRCTCEQQLDRKTVSKWSRALRYVARFKKRVPLKTFMKNRGGVNACAALFAECVGRSKQ